MEQQDEFNTAMHIDMLMELGGEEDVIYRVYLDLSAKHGKEKALEEMGLDEPPSQPFVD